MKKYIVLIIFISSVLMICVGIVKFNNTVRLSAKKTLSNPSQSLTPTSYEKDSIQLSITSPESGTNTSSSIITISGSTHIKCNIIINDKDLSSNIDGSFSSTIRLDEGENYISIVAYDDMGNVAERELIINRSIEGI